MAKYTSSPFGRKTQSDLRNPNKTQVAATYDVLSEGEIGLPLYLLMMFLL